MFKSIFCYVHIGFTPENVKSLKVVFKLSNCYTTIFCCRASQSKSKSQILSLENLRGIVHRAKTRKPANSVVTEQSKSPEKADSSSKIFQPNKSVFFVFLLWAITAKAMGIWLSAGGFPVVERQRKCGRKDCEMHVSQPMNIGVCYGVVVFFSSVVYVSVD